VHATHNRAAIANLQYARRACATLRRTARPGHARARCTSVRRALRAARTVLGVATRAATEVSCAAHCVRAHCCAACAAAPTVVAAQRAAVHNRARRACPCRLALPRYHIVVPIPGVAMHGAMQEMFTRSALQSEAEKFYPWFSLSSCALSASAHFSPWQCTDGKLPRWR